MVRVVVCSIVVRGCKDVAEVVLGERGGYVKKDVDGEEAEVSPSEEGNAIGPWSGIIAL